jgi:multicomponent Na+:H+ antiporter subunit A
VRNAIAGIVAGLGAFGTIWAALSRPAPEESVAAQHIIRADDAHGGDIVTVILADFRGFDTLVEITVLAVAIIGVAALLRRGRPW